MSEGLRVCGWERVRGWSFGLAFVCAFVCAFVPELVCSFRGLFAFACVLSWVEIYVNYYGRSSVSYAISCNGPLTAAKSMVVPDVTVP